MRRARSSRKAQQGSAVGYSMWNASDLMPRSSCLQVTGAALGKPGRARGEYVPIAVVLRPFLR
jgi:hypothetical protein